MVKLVPWFQIIMKHAELGNIIVVTVRIAFLYSSWNTCGKFNTCMTQFKIVNNRRLLFSHTLKRLYAATCEIASLMYYALCYSLIIKGRYVFSCWLNLILFSSIVMCWYTCNNFSFFPFCLLTKQFLFSKYIFT